MSFVGSNYAAQGYEGRDVKTCRRTTCEYRGMAVTHGDDVVAANVSPCEAIGDYFSNLFRSQLLLPEEQHTAAARPL